MYRVTDKFRKLPFTLDFRKKVDIRKIIVLNHLKQALGANHIQTLFSLVLLLSGAHNQGITSCY